MQISPDEPLRADVRALLEAHLRDMHALSPPGSVHALDAARLCAPDMRFWTARDAQGGLLGCAALKALGAAHAEVKAMRTLPAQRRSGVASALLRHLIAQARASGVARLSLETGAQAAFAPAVALYERFGFAPCEPFADYRPDPHSVFMTRAL